LDSNAISGEGEIQESVTRRIFSGVDQSTYSGVFERQILDLDVAGVNHVEATKTEAITAIDNRRGS
jgi:uncharacterized protein involved in tellurium resistance